MTAESERWTIRELGERAEAALSVDYDGPASGQIRAVPDTRTIRYYTTLGLIDRPAEMRGRTAYYDHRHLQQLVAIKRLQARGLSLAEVQARLANIAPDALAALARLPEHGARRDRPRRRRAAAGFWREPPAEATDAAPAEATDAAPAEAADAASDPSEDRAAPPITPITEIQLAPGVVLRLDGVREVTEQDARCVAAASAALLAVLDERGLRR